MSENLKMYKVSKYIDLPENLKMPTSMFSMEPTYKLDKDLSQVYYGNSRPSNSQASKAQNGSVSLADVESRQSRILEKLKEFKKSLDSLAQKDGLSSCNSNVQGGNSKTVKPIVDQDLVISCPPSRPLYSISLLKKALVETGYDVYSTCATHSSVKTAVPVSLQLNEDEGKSRLGRDLFLSVQWKDQQDVALMVTPLKQWLISGEGNVIRYISRLFPAGSSFNYESGDLVATAATDLLLDDIQSSLVDGDNKARMGFVKKLNARLGRTSYLEGNQMGICDIFATSVLLQFNMESSVPNNVSSWLKRLMQWGSIKKEIIKGTDVDLSKNVFYNRLTFEKFLKMNGIKFQIRDHPEVFTVDTMMQYVSDMKGLIMKNLFLKDRKGKLFLLATRYDAKVQLSKIGEQISTKDLRFANEDVLFSTLGVKQGCVTLFALINDFNNKVTLLLDEAAVADEIQFVNFHPMSNAATLGVSPKDLGIFLDTIGHKPVLVKL